MNKNISSPEKSLTKEMLAEEAKDLLLYVAQSSPDDISYFYDGIDVEKILALIDAEDLSRLPALIAKELMEDDRGSIKKALIGKIPQLKKAIFFSTLEDWGVAEGVSSEQIVEKGRGAIGRALKRVSESQRKLRPEEVNAIASIISTIDDPAVIDEIIPFAQEYYDIARELILNRNMKKEHAEKLIDSSMEKIKENWHWPVLLIEIYLKFSRVLDENYMNKLRRLPDIKEAENHNKIAAAGKKIKSKKKKKKRASTESRRKKRLKEKETKRLRQLEPPAIADEKEKAA